MPRPRKWENELQRREAQNDSRKHARDAHHVEFIAVDGEGVGRWRDHRYVLLGVGENQIENGGGLRFPQIAEFLWEQFLGNPSAAFVGFFLGYDFTQWLKTIPENRARMLLTAEGRAKRERRKSGGNPTPFPVQFDEWEFDILGFKRFKLRPVGGASWLYICDAGSFFQASLMSVIDPKKWNEPIVTEQEYETLKKGKESRDTAALDADMRRYNSLENNVLARLMGRLNIGFTEAGIRLKRNQWFGPGQAAQEWLKTTDLPRRTELEVIPSRSLEGGRLAYYGGWFEIFAHGHIPGMSYEYDINSAYPWIASRLPCLIHGQWTRGMGIPRELPGNAIRLVHAAVSGSDRRLGAMLHRVPDGSIRRPSSTGGWYWQSELDAARRAGAVDTVEVKEWIQYDPCDCRAPMRGLAGLYDKRLRVGKNTPAGKSYKLIYNSVYGKLAQSVGEPKFANSLYASLITSGCREMILDAIATHPRKSMDLLMVATDGVYFRSNHPALSISQAIGDWDVSEKENLTLFKPGIYWDESTREQIRRNENPMFKARGVNAAEFAKQIQYVDNHFDAWQLDAYPLERDPDSARDGWYPSITFTSGFSMVTCQQALQRGKWFLAGSVSSQELTQDADPVAKRHSGYYEDGVFWSRPYADGGYGDTESTPYDKRFGQPDPEEYGINPDGNVLDLWKGMFNG